VTDWSTADPVDPVLEADEVHVWRVDVADGQEGHVGLQRLLAHLAPDELERAERRRSRADRDRFVVAHGSLRMILGGYTKRPPGSLSFTAGRHGKPALVPPTRDAPPSFNLSHSGDVVLVAVAADREVGIDVERCDPARVSLDVADRFLPASVASAIRDLPVADRVRPFFEAWTRMEAEAKGRGIGVGWARSSAASGVATSGSATSGSAASGSATPGHRQPVGSTRLIAVDADHVAALWTTRPASAIRRLRLQPLA
jgi:4'-phosphopantetheinyl transferase